MTEHVFLVAFTVEADDRETAEYQLHGRLIPTLQSRDDESPILEWWVAEDDRRDGSDNDSAIFVPKGTVTTLREAGFNVRGD